MMAKWTVIVGLGAVSWPSLAGAGEWPQFRGPHGAGVSTESRLPDQWSVTTHVAWKAKLPGYGWSSPIVWGDKVFVTTAVSDRQRRPSDGLVAGGPGGPPPASSVVSPFVQQMLGLTADQTRQLEALHMEIDGKLRKLLTAEQNKQLNDSQEGFGRGGFGGRPQPGSYLQIMAPAQQDKLKLTADQRKELAALQKDLDNKLGNLLTEEQKQMRLRRVGGAARGPGRSDKPPDTVYRWELYCLRAADGQILWKRTTAEGKPAIPTHPSNTYASETPVTDGERVYAYIGMVGVFCYDLDGKLLWKVPLASYRIAKGYGTGSSPALDGGRLFIQCDNDEKSFLLALDARTGKELWRAERPERASWSTPLVWKNKERTEVVCLGTPKVRSYDPATGAPLWELGGLDGQAYASMAADADLLFLGIGTGLENGPPGPGGPDRDGQGGGRPLFAIKPGARGDITPQKGVPRNAAIAWQRPKAAPAIASPLLYQGYLYVLEQRGMILSCYEAATGKQLFRERTPGGQAITASPWAYEGKVFFLDNRGTTHVIQAGPVLKVLGESPLGAMCWATPAVAGGALYVRTVDHLYCIRP